MIINCPHCLRSPYTENIIKELLETSRSINIVGQSGQGRRRLLEDIQNCQWDNVLVLLVNMKSYKESYQGFIEELWRLIPQVETVPPDVNLSKLVARLEATGQRSLILMDHFDDLLDNAQVDKKFDVSFFDALNSIHNRQHIALVAVTEKPIQYAMVYANSDWHRCSWLDVKRKDLPPLTLAQISTELQRRNLAVVTEEFSQLVNAIHQHKMPYALLDYLVDKVNNCEDEEIVFSERLRKWQKQFDKRPFWTLRNVHRTSQKVSTALQVTQVHKPFKLALDYTVDYITNSFSTLISAIGRLFERRNDRDDR